MSKNNDYINIIFLSNDWEKYHRKAFTKNLIKNLSLWSDVILIQLPVSLLVHLFTNFKKKIFGFLKGKYNTIKLDNTAIMFTPLIFFHYLLWKNKFIFKIDCILLNFQLNRYIKKNYGKKEIIIWYYFPFLLNYIIKSNAILKIYDQYDIYHMDINDNIDEKLELMNNELIKISDIVFCTTKYLYSLSKKFNKNSFYITNGNNFEFLSAPVKEKALISMPNKDSKTIGYLGGIRNWLDFELLNYIIPKLSDVNFIFIGSISSTAKKDMEKIKSYKNVLWIDYVVPNHLPKYLSLFNVGIIPFKTTEFFKCVFPNKFYEYLASRIPVVCTNLLELKEYQNIIGYSYEKEDFLKNCLLALDGYYEKYFDEYTRISKENSWSEKVKIEIDIIKNELKLN